MPRAYKHFKVHVSVLTHRKMERVVRDPELFNLWVKLGLLAIESWAARHDETFNVSDRQLVVLTSKKRTDAAHRVMRKLIEVSPLSAEYRPDSESKASRSYDGTWSIKFSNLVKKQGFVSKNTQRIPPPYKARKLLPLNREEGNRKKRESGSPEELAEIEKFKAHFVN